MPSRRRCGARPRFPGAHLVTDRNVAHSPHTTTHCAPVRGDLPTELSRDRPTTYFSSTPPGRGQPATRRHGRRCRSAEVPGRQRSPRASAMIAASHAHARTRTPGRVHCQVPAGRHGQSPSVGVHRETEGMSDEQRTAAAAACSSHLHYICVESTA